MYNQAGSTVNAAYCLLRKASVEHTTLSKLQPFKRSTNYETLKDAIAEYERNCETFISSFSFEKSRLFSSRAAVQSMREDVKEIENCLDFKRNILTKQFENLTITPNKKTVETENLSAVCTYWRKNGHFSNQSRENPTRNARCDYCQKNRHTAEACYQKQIIISRNLLATENRSEEIKADDHSKHAIVMEPQVSVTEEAEPSLT